MSVRVLTAALATALLALLAAGCGGRPSSVRALFERVQELNAAGRTTEIWDLQTDDAKKRFRDAIDGYRDWLRKNDSPVESLYRQYKCTREEFMVLPYVELYRRENLGNETGMVGAKVVDVQADPRRPGEEVVTFDCVGDIRGYLRGRKVDGGYGLVEILLSPRSPRK